MTNDEIIDSVARAYDAMCRTRQELEKVVGCICGPTGDLPERSEVRRAVEQSREKEKELLNVLKALSGLKVKVKAETGVKEEAVERLAFISKHGTSPIVKVKKGSG